MFDRKKLAYFMKEHNITNVALAKQLCVTEGYVRHILIGQKQPSLHMAFEIAQLMGCQIDDLILKD